MTNSAYERIKHSPFGKPPSVPGFYHAVHRSGLPIVVEVPESLAPLYYRYNSVWRRTGECYTELEIREWGERIK